MNKKIHSAIISVYHKDGLEPIVKFLHHSRVQIYSTGGTQKFIEDLGIPVTPVEALTSYPSILGGRVKTLHPKVFGGILFRRDHENDMKEMGEYAIPSLDLVVVDLYPFEETVASGADEQDIIEKIDIGGISLIRAAAKNFKDVAIVSSRDQYQRVEATLKEKGCSTDLNDRRLLAAEAFDQSSHYDSAIFKYFNQSLDEENRILNHKKSVRNAKVVRYGENPHQQGAFFGELDLSIIHI